MSALVPLAKKFTSEEPSIEIIGGENVLSWPFVVSLHKTVVDNTFQINNHIYLLRLINFFMSTYRSNT